MNERGKMDFQILLPLGIIVLACLIAIGAHFWKEPETTVQKTIVAAQPDDRIASVLTQIEAIQASVSALAKSIETVNTNNCKLRLELEGLKSEQRFPREMILKQDKPWKIDLVQDKAPPKGAGIRSLIPKEKKRAN